MAIVKMNRFTLLAFEQQREDLLKSLQKTGLAHFKNITEAEEDDNLELTKLSYAEGLSYAETELARVSFALNRIKPFIGKKAPEAPDISFEEFDTFLNKYDYASVCDKIKELDEKQKSLKAERTKLKTDNEALLAWQRLDVSTNELDTATSTVYFTGSFPRQSAPAFIDALSAEYPCSYAELLDPLREDIAALIITVKEDADGVAQLAKTYGFTKITLNLDCTASELISANNKRITDTETEDEKITEEISAYAQHYNNLSITSDYFTTLAERKRVCGNFLKTKQVFITEGWYAADDTKTFEDAIKSVCGTDYYLDIEEVEKDSEEVPIKLKNNAFVSAFQDVTEMYSLPKYNEVDPTPMLTPFYILFFAAMFGDLGYGLVLAIGAAAFIMVSKPKGSSRKFFEFFIYLGIAGACMGVLYGSFFGVTFFAPMTHAETGEPAPILDLQNNVMFILILSVVVGAVHIFVGLFMKGYVLVKNGKVLDAVFDSLFLILTVGGIIAFALASILDGYSQFSTPAGAVAIAGAVGLVLTQGRSSPSIGGKIGNGIYSLYSLTGFIGDFVSYTRLMALALASTYIAYSFNLMAGLIAGVDGLSDIGAGYNYIRLIPAAIVAVFGAALNMGLGALGAYVHSCRLQYVEYFGKFYEGGGVPFRPFEIKNTFTNISKGGNEL